MWKARDIGFLEVVIRLNGVKMEKEKVQGVVEWPVLRGVNYVEKFLGLAYYYRQFVKVFV